VKTLLPLVAAGGTFAGAAVLGLLAGILIGDRRGEPLLAPAGLILGALIGGYSAFRLLARAMR
jgi:outer membrane lipoprotein SlyB